jgi:hypothetical protein
MFGFLYSRRVVVNLDDGTSIDGMFWKRRGSILVLKNATLHQPGIDPTPMDGEVVVERARVLFIQVI